MRRTGLERGLVRWLLVEFDLAVGGSGGVISSRSPSHWTWSLNTSRAGVAADIAWAVTREPLAVKRPAAPSLFRSTSQSWPERLDNVFDKTTRLPTDRRWVAKRKL